IRAGTARFTVLTPRLIRMEFSENARFEDRASQAFICRNLAVPRFETTDDGSVCVIETDALIVRYVHTEGRFGPENLSVTLKQFGDATWRPGDADDGNLRGTTRTLDGVSGSCPVEPGLLSRDGWVVVDDGQRPLFDGSEWNWMTPRSSDDEEASRIDWYFFGYGHDYIGALQDFTKVAGRIPMPPRYVYGSWFSRYWPYSDEEFKAIVAEFGTHDVPLDVLVLDMDWHLDGWTGYSWNPDYFPDPDAFLAWCREKNIRTTLNLHPADGIGTHETAHARMAEILGATPDEPISFDCSDKAFVRAYFEELHHPLERQGVDFWWMDWQQGTDSGIDGVDPLWWLNHLHWEDMERNCARGDLRPLIFSRWGGLGNHRYQIGFSGDTFCNWESLAFQPWFTSTAGNVGYAYWSHDIGGHQPGPVDDELYTRWVQFGAFSPILRTHSGRHPGADRRIWTFEPRCFEAKREAFHLRYALLPYIYAMTRRTYDDALPLCRPMYYAWPDEERAYASPDQYMFGDELLVAPVIHPINASTGAAPSIAWLPPGTWTSWVTGRTVEGPADIRDLAALDEIPVFARAGAIIPMAPPMHRTAERAVDPLILRIFPGDEGDARVYEDDGLSLGYTREECAWTPVAHRIVDGRRVIEIGPVEGSFDGMAATRAYEVQLPDVWPAARVRIDGRIFEPGDAERPYSYDAVTLTCVVRTGPVDVRSGVTIEIEPLLDATHDHLLRAGLRGQLAVLEEIADALGDASPASLRDALAIRVLVASDPAAAVSRIEELQANWQAILKDVASCDAPRAAQAASRLAGVSCLLETGPSEDGAGAVSTEVWMGPRFVAPSDGTIEAQLQIDGAWSLVGGGKDRSAKGTASAPVRATATLDAAAVPGEGRLQARAVVELGGVPVEARAEQRCYPSVNGWLIVGPFACPHADQPEAAHGPEEAGEFDGVDPNATYAAPGGPMRAWRRVVRKLQRNEDPTREFHVDLHKVFGGHTDHAMCYAACELVSDAARDAVLALGSDDGPTVWVNGEQVHHEHVQRGYQPKQDRIPVRLREGTNTVLLKIQQVWGGWSFAMHIEGPDGEALPGVRVALPE
ncbi:MAG: TIM-barrel domain-containing protein, partial [Planctomycetota bacterium]